jgi:hypothetical protein
MSEIGWILKLWIASAVILTPCGSCLLILLSPRSPLPNPPLIKRANQQTHDLGTLRFGTHATCNSVHGDEWISQFLKLTNVARE